MFPPYDTPQWLELNAGGCTCHCLICMVPKSNNSMPERCVSAIADVAFRPQPATRAVLDRRPTSGRQGGFGSDKPLANCTLWSHAGELFSQRPSATAKTYRASPQHAAGLEAARGRLSFFTLSFDCRHFSSRLTGAARFAIIGCSNRAGSVSLCELHRNLSRFPPPTLGEATCASSP